MSDTGIKLIANNKKAYHDYFVEESYECGIELAGTEVKSLRMGHCSIKEAYCQVRNAEVYVFGMHINPYEKGNIFNRDPMRERRLLLHRREIDRLSGLIQQQGYTLVPLRVYFRNSRVKLEIGLCRGKKNYDKREDLKKRDQRRALEKEFKRASIRI